MHEYGPHRDEDAPTHVDLATGKGVRHVKPEDLLTRPRDFVRLAPGLVLQTRNLNTLAYLRSRHA